MRNLLEVYLKSVPTLKSVILNTISAYDIYCELTRTELEVGGSGLINSPLRSDSKPTFGLFLHNEADILMFKDFAYESGDVFKFVRLFASYNDDILVRSLIDVVYYLNSKLDLDILNDSRSADVMTTKKRFNRSFNARTARNILFKSRRFTEMDEQYWGQYNISVKTLKLFDVRSVESILSEERRILRSFGRTEICYVYVVYNKVKLYQPFEQGTYKWRNTCPAWYIQGWKQRVGREDLIITKSMKDVLTFYEILGDRYDVIAPHSENYNFTDKVVNYINKKYKNIYVIYDLDRAGVNGANKLKHLYKWEPKFIDTKRIMINGKLKVIDKDISDLTANRGSAVAIQRCKDLNL